MATKSAAVLTIFNAAKMTPSGRRNVAKWLDKQKQILLHDSASLSKRYTARYLYIDGDR